MSGYRGLTGRGIQDGHENSRLLKAFDLVPNDSLLTKIAATGVDLRVVEWVKEFLLGRSQRGREHGQISEEVTVTTRLPQGSELLVVPLLCLP